MLPLLSASRKKVGEMKELEKIGDAIIEALGKCPSSDVLGVLTGHLVGLTKELTRRQGHDPDKSITLTCAGQRDITIHPLGQQKGE